jgi:cytochrome c oxidase assembly factor CtaG
MLAFVASLPELFLLHTGGPYPDGWLKSDWRPEPGVILGAFAMIAAYVWWTGPRNRAADGTPILPVSGGQRLAFVAGALVFLVALNPPLDDWADSYLLSAHMAQHMLLIFVVAPLWLAGMPAWLLRRLVRFARAERIGYALTRPAVALLLPAVLVIVWHMPFAYDAALGSTPIHIAQHLSFLGAALLSWWPVLGRLPEWPGLSKPMQCLYLFATSLPGGIVGAFVTLAEPGLYDYDASPRIWGIDLATDQQIAGLLMWVVTSVIYLLIITVIFFQWAAAEDAKEGRSRPRPPAEPAPRGADLTS